MKIENLKMLVKIWIPAPEAAAPISTATVSYTLQSNGIQCASAVSWQFGCRLRKQQQFVPSTRFSLIEKKNKPEHECSQRCVGTDGKEKSGLLKLHNRKPDIEVKTRKSLYERWPFQIELVNSGMLLIGAAPSRTLKTCHNNKEDNVRTKLTIRRHITATMKVRIFGILDCKSLLNCELTCKRWSSAILENLQHLPKLQTDQIRILFDEAEIFIFPVDEKKCPGLKRRLRHLTTQSLFIRGLIPIESVPVLRSLLSLTLRPQQIYFIWCKFSPDSVPVVLNKF
ncbi:unnamed protein product [Angiostrongylus costaricensis]|uniref:F-box domain-containing protein n=1 Tax=Angiostrongylus costaricensis TaxID=334426 RepID=A0A158PIU7_ANGCS|nr:unnamed protein product [Angiostrongylus costaricensis]